MHPPSDQTPAADLLVRYRDGDRGAFRELVDQFQDRMLQFFFRLCWSREAAEDLTQDLFLRLLQASQRYRPQGKLEHLIWRTATNLWIDHARARRPKHRRAASLELLLPVLEDEAAQPLQLVLLDEERLAVRHGLQQLSDAHRLVIELAVNQELPYREIGELLDIPVGTVKSRMHHAIAALRRMLDPTPTALAVRGPTHGRVASHA